jgi:hypothetical protein
MKLKTNSLLTKVWYVSIVRQRQDTAMSQAIISEDATNQSITAKPQSFLIETYVFLILFLGLISFGANKYQNAITLRHAAETQITMAWTGTPGYYRGLSNKPAVMTLRYYDIEIISWVAHRHGYSIMILPRTGIAIDEIGHTPRTLDGFAVTEMSASTSSAMLRRIEQAGVRRAAVGAWVDLTPNPVPMRN